MPHAAGGPFLHPPGVRFDQGIQKLMKPLAQFAVSAGLATALLLTALSHSHAQTTPTENAPQSVAFSHPQVARDAARYETFLKKAWGGRKVNADALVRNANAMLAQDARGASRGFASAVVAKPDNAAAWMGLARALLAIPTNTLQGSERYDIPVNASGAAYRGYQRATSRFSQAEALGLLGQALKRRSYWRPAIDALRVANLLQASVQRQAAYEALRATHGFRMINTTTQAEAVSPRVCLEFSEQLSTAQVGFVGFISINGKDPEGATREGQQLCLEGFAHGERYEVKVRAGLPSDIGEVLTKDITLAVYVPDRKPMARFTGRNYVLPSRGQQGIPVVTVNTQAVALEVYRIGDRALNEVVQRGDLQRQLSTWDIDTIKSRSGAKVYDGRLSVTSKLNTEVTTAFPVDEAIGTLQPGAYAMVARPADDPKSASAYQVATQWFIVSDLGLTAFSGDDGVHAFVRSLADTRTLEGVDVRLVARNNEVLATAKTDARGYATFDAALARGEGGQQPAMLVAQNGATDYAFLDLSGAAFDLSDRGVAGRAAPGALDGFLATERGVYRPGEEVHFTALLRTRGGKASNLPVTLVVTRPDGVEHRRTVLPDQGLGGRSLTLALTHGTMTGTWRARVHLDPKAAALSETAFLVEDFVPERMDLALKPAGDQLVVGQDGAINAKGVFLYGPPAAGMALEGEVVVKTTTNGPSGYRGYRFGLADEQVSPVRKRFSGLPTTDKAGLATIPVSLPAIPKTGKPLEASIVVRLREPGGRTVERTLRLPVQTGLSRIGVKPLFDAQSLGQGETAQFAVVLLDGAGAPTDAQGLKWTLSRLETRWQWYSRDGAWSYESMTLTRKVSDGTFDVAKGTPSKLSTPVEFGRYQLEVADPTRAGGPVTTVVFNAGWYTAGDNVESPEMLDVALDKPLYTGGETAKVRISDKRGGRALIAVISGDMKTFQDVAVPAGGVDVPVSVSQAWGAGAYVTAMLYRPMDATAKRMPSRAVGIKWLGLDQSTRTLNIALGGPDKIGSGETLSVPVTLSGLKAGEAAYVSLAAVDVGILNLTGYETPKPGTWFNGQTKLAMSIRDYYGRLIDGMRAERGRLRSGGDAAGGLAMQGAPPSEETVAVYSGLVRVDENGKADVAFELPEFNGRVRLMAMAWSNDKLGHADRDITIRDPLALTLSAPRFLTLGDTARLRVDVHNVEGAAADYAFAVDRTFSDGAATSLAKTTLTLAAGERQPQTLTLEPTDVGLTTYGVRITGPGGIDVSRTLQIDIKPPAGDIKRTTVSSLQPGGKLTLTGDLMQDLIAGRSQLSVSVGTTARFDIPSLLTQLDRYPYGCAEQTVSRALPLVYANAVAAEIGIATDAKLRKRVQVAIDRVFQMQNASGAFGTWGPSQGDIWLTAYVTDFLSRAREKGYTVPERGFTLALDKLQNFIAYAQDFEKGGENRAYALYVLARNKRAPAGELRYYADERLGRFSSPLAKAQLGAALAMIGDKSRAARAFTAAVNDVNAAHAASAASATGARSVVRFARTDYGSHLRDGAAVLTLASESGMAAGKPASLKDVVAAAFETRRHTSTQEQAWMLLAAHALGGANAPLMLGVDGNAHTGQLVRTFHADEIASQPVTIVNKGDQAVDAVVSVVGAAMTPEPAIAKGFKISRRMFTLDGAALETNNADGTPKAISQNTRAVVVVDVTTDDPGGRLLVVDRLPAGFEIENPRLVSSGDVKALSWIKPSQRPEHTEFRDDRFVAAFNLNAANGADAKPAGTTLSMAYIVRAVTPGTYVQPATTVEDMYRPEAYARTDADEVLITAPTAE